MNEIITFHKHVDLAPKKPAKLIIVKQQCEEPFVQWFRSVKYYHVYRHFR